MFLHNAVLPSLPVRALTALLISFAALLALAWVLGPAPVAYYSIWHSGLEILAITISALVFAAAWTAHRVRPQKSLVILSCGFLALLLFDLSHVLSSPGMPDYFTPNSIGKAINFWLAARYAGALAMLAIVLSGTGSGGQLLPASCGYRYGALAGTFVFVLLTHLWFMSFPEFTPRTFDEATGLTPFKRWAESGVILLHLLALGVLLRHPRGGGSFHRSYFFMALAAATLSEVFFVLYVSADDVYNLIGHVYKVVAWIFLYRAIFVHTVIQPYAEMQASEDTLRKLKLAVEQSPSTIMITDLHSRLQYANLAFERSTGYSLEEALGHTPAILHSGRNPRRTYDEMWSALKSGKPWRGELVNCRKDGVQYLESVLISPVKDAAGNVTSYLAIKDDITQQRLDQERIEQLSNFDALTGLPNRALFATRFEPALAMSQRDAQQLAVLCVSMDNFKSINQSFGEEVGDEVLVEMAGRLKAVADDAGLVSRHNGDEFIVIRPNTDMAGAAAMAERLQNEIRRPCVTSNNELVVTACVGISLSPDDGFALDTLLQRAVTAAFRAKTEGRNSLRFFSTEMQQGSTRLLRLENALRTAISHGELRVVYQPQVGIETRKVVGVEALVRWEHPELGSISPAEFIPVAESSGQIIELGQWILRTALHQAQGWRAQGHTDLILAVNLSLQQFRHDGLLRTVELLLEETGFPAGNLELELTESIAMDNPEQAVRTVQALRDRGVLLSIDDFGTGYSSLSYLKRLQLNKLKIDKSFIDDIAQDGTDVSIVTAIIGMARSLGMTTIAEGVETARQLEVLHELGCDEVQGYFFSRPLSASGLEAFLPGEGGPRQA